MREMGVICANNHATEQLAARIWIEPFLDQVGEGVTLAVRRLSGPDEVSRHSVEDMIQRAFVTVYCGHATEWTVGDAMFDTEVYIDGANVLRAAGNHLWVIGCYSARHLGPLAVARGVASYVGMRATMWAEHRFLSITAPLVSESLMNLASGMATVDVRERVVEELDRLSARLEADGPQGADDYAFWTTFLALQLMSATFFIHEYQDAPAERPTD